MIEAIDVHKSFPSGDDVVEALRGVSFQVDTGAFCFIVGPSGSGKSTLLYLLGSLDTPTSGTIRVEGKDYATTPEEERDRFRRTDVGFVFQNFNLIGNLTAVDNVLLPFLSHGRTKELQKKAIDLLSRLGLANRLQHRPHQLSGGQQQRVAIARALVRDPEVILADEPTGELDSKAGDEIFAILRQQQHERGSTMVVVTHDRRFIKQEDRVIELEDGHIRAQ